MKTRYYACVDGERIVPLGDCECFDDADEKSPAGTMWLYDEAGLRALIASIKEELECSSVALCQRHYNALMFGSGEEHREGVALLQKSKEQRRKS